MKMSTQTKSNEIEEEIDTIDAIFGDDFNRLNNGFNVKLSYSNVEVIVSFELKDYPQTKPKVCMKYNDKQNLMKSVHKQSLQECIVQQIKDSSLESEGYLFEFVEIVTETINVFFESCDLLIYESKLDENNTDIGTYILQYDHMRNEIKYISILKKWCNELELVGRLIFYENIICHIIQGTTDSLAIFMKRSKTQKVDIDSKGRKCKEKMLKTLYKCDNNDIVQLYNEWKVERLSNKDNVLHLACGEETILSILHNTCITKKPVSTAFKYLHNKKYRWNRD
eukprot:75656_1